MKTKPIKKAVFPVAGLGTRFLPATKAIPKEMLSILDTPLIQYAVEEAYEAGIEDIIFITGKGKAAIEDHFDHSPQLEKLLSERNELETLEKIKALLPSKNRMAFIRQGSPRGLGHAVWCARSLVGDNPFALILADDIFQGPKPALKQLMETYEKVGGNVVSVMEVPESDISKYGILKPGKVDGKLVEVEGLIEKPTIAEAPSNLAISGRYIIQPEIFDHLERSRIGANGEIQITDSLVNLIGQQPFHGVKVDSTRYDCGSKLGLLRANLAFALERDDLKDQVQEMINSLYRPEKD